MKEYKSTLPEIKIILKKGNCLNVQVKKSSDIVNVLRQIWDNDSLPIYESVICIFLNRCNKTIGWFKVSQGGLNSSIIDNRLILATGLQSLASSIIMAHNHPSGNTQPSEPDISSTRKLKEAAKLMDIDVLDHIILTEESYYSLADNGDM